MKKIILIFAVPILLYGSSNNEIVRGYLRTTTISDCQAICSQYYIESEIDGGFGSIFVTSVNPNLDLSSYINRFVEIDLDGEVPCECTSFGIRSIDFSEECQYPVDCFQDPCIVVDQCQINTPVECISNYCGDCHADFYDLNGNLVDCFTSSENSIEGRWHLVGYEDNVMYQFDNNYRYSIYSIDGTFGGLEEAGGTPNPYYITENIIAIDLFFGNIVSYQMNYKCEGQVVEFIYIPYGTIHSTLFREGYNYQDSSCNDMLDPCMDLSQSDCLGIDGCEWIESSNMPVGFCAQVDSVQCEGLNISDCNSFNNYCEWIGSNSIPGNGFCVEINSLYNCNEIEEEEICLYYGCSWEEVVNSPNSGSCFNSDEQENPCEEGFIEINDFCFHVGDISVLEKMINNSYTSGIDLGCEDGSLYCGSPNPFHDSEDFWGWISYDGITYELLRNGNGIVEPLELGIQQWENGRLKALDCGAYIYCQLSGSIPEQINDLTELEHFRVEGNYLSGLIPGSLCQLNIDYDNYLDFDVRYNRLCPPYPDCIDTDYEFWGQYDEDCNANNTCDEIAERYEDLHLGEYTTCQFDNDCMSVNGHCDVGLGGCHYSVNEQNYPEAEISELVDGWVQGNCMTGVCDCMPEPYAQCVSSICTSVYCIGDNPAGCFQTGCEEGFECVINNECNPSWCGCDDMYGYWFCTEDCGGGSCVATIMIGDLNNDSQINIVDVVLLVNTLLDSAYNNIGDLNEDGVLNILDVVLLIDFILYE